MSVHLIKRIRLSVSKLKHAPELPGGIGVASAHLMAQHKKAAGFPAAGFPPEWVCEGGGGGRKGGRE